jgi:hypothetical protein
MTNIQRIRTWALRDPDDRKINIKWQNAETNRQWLVEAESHGAVTYDVNSGWQATIELAAAKVITLLTDLGEEVPNA